MRVMIAGVDGYLGWPLALRLGALGHEVSGIDLHLRRHWVGQMGSCSAVFIAPIYERLEVYHQKFGVPIKFYSIDLTNYENVLKAYEEAAPDAIVYLGEQPSAPFSQMDVEHAVLTQQNNVVGTLVTLHAMRDVCPHAHLLKLGSMGEYGTPACSIPEGCFPRGSFWIEAKANHERGKENRGNLSGMMFPRQAGSWYHLSKVHDTHNVEFACRTWSLRATDVMQGPVYGSWTDEMGGDDRLRTRLDFDECFGTVINRFCVQAVLGMPLTVYGAGGQTRGYLPLEDSIQCMVLALEQAADAGEYRTLNQFDQTYSVNELAETVADIAERLGLHPQIEHLTNPRTESEDHYYAPAHNRLLEMGYVPTGSLAMILERTIKDLLRWGNREHLVQFRHVVAPKIRWRP